jgi:cyclase
MRARVVVQLWAAMLVASGWSLAQDFDKVELTTAPVAKRVFVIAGGGGNIGVLVGDGGLLLIDTAYGELEGKIRAALEGLGGAPVRFVVNTHWHFDHVGCNGCFAGGAGTTVIAPAETRERMATEQEFPLLGARSPAFPEAALPTIEVANEAVVHFADEQVRLVRVAHAHSGSDLFVLLQPANVLHAGDLFWSEGYPYIGTPHGGSVDGMIAAADRMLAMADDRTRIIPGHGAVSDRAGLERFRTVLQTVRDRVAVQIAAGRTADEIVASRPTAEWDEQRRVGMDPETFVRLVHRDLISAAASPASD